jgi:hypothetical protein
MAFPVVQSTITSEEVTEVTSHDVSLPAGVSSGDLVVVYVAVKNNRTVTYPAGWTEILDTNGTGVSISVAYRRCDGTEGATIIVTSSILDASSHGAYRITGHHATTNPEVGTTTAGTDQSPDPPSLTPSWGAEDTLWIAFHGAGGDHTTSAFPASYTDGIQENDSGSGISSASARRNLNAASENPGAFSLSSGTIQWRANTIAIRPASVAGQAPRSMHQYRLRRM